ncbi:B-cell receptor CD22-like [Lithobates pipiens]
MNGKTICIIFLLQATYTVQQNTFNFPSEIQALIGSCVEIPCTVRTSETEPKNEKVVWHIVKRIPGSRIIYSSDPSEISTKYKNRAALIGSPEDSCTLRINEVTKKDEKMYYPGDRKLPFKIKVQEYVQLRVTDVPPQPVLSVPGEMIVGTPTLLSCSVEHTCATSPPSLNWNISGLPLSEYNKDLGSGKYLKTSELTYLASGDHKGSSIFCTAIFRNGQTSRTAAKLNIIQMEKKNVNKNIRVIIIVACLISLLLITFFIWRFLLGNKASTSRAPNSFRRKKDYFETKGTKDNRYTDLMERENTDYCILEPATRKMIQGKNNLTEYKNTYEDMRPLPATQKH